MILQEVVKWEDVHDTKALGEESDKHAQELLRMYFQQDDHSDQTKIYHRVALLNSFYSTRMGAERCFQVSK